MQTRKLVLFDIDGTLVSDHGASRDAFREALATVYGFRGSLDHYDFSGRTDPGITRMVLRDAGFAQESIDSGFGDLWGAYLDGLKARAQGERIRELPGTRAVLETLERSEFVTLGLLTGNIEPGARLKLAPPGFNAYFAFGAFGSDSENRDDLAPVAVERAQVATGFRFATEDVVIVGDSVFDVRCARPHGARSVAVASGRTPAERLFDEDPDVLLASLENCEDAIRAILG